MKGNLPLLYRQTALTIYKPKQTATRLPSSKRKQQQSSEEKEVKKPSQRSSRKSYIKTQLS